MGNEKSRELAKIKSTERHKKTFFIDLARFLSEILVYI